MEYKTIHAADLTNYIADIVHAGGSSAEEARTVAENLVLANLCGHDSHGVGMIPRYIDAVKAGGLKPNQRLSVVADLGHMVVLDGNMGYGQTIGKEAMRLAIARARQHGSAIVGLRNTHHIARIGQWAEDCIEAGLISIHFVNAVTMAPAVAPWGGSDARFVTNPVCIGIPRKNAPPFVLDFATSRIAMGKVRVAMNKGEHVAAGTLIDSTGLPTMDPRVLFEQDARGKLGALLPFGEHKGYGLAVACELLSAALLGGCTQRTPNAGPEITNNMLSIVIDPGKLDVSRRFDDEMSGFIDWVTASPPAPDVEEVMIAGDPERKMREKRGREGIPIDATTWAELKAAAQAVGIARHAAFEW